MGTPGCESFPAFVTDEDGERIVLGTLGGFAAQANGINDLGVVVGQADTPAFEPNG